MLTLAAFAVELVSKFAEGAWLVAIVIPLFVVASWPEPGATSSALH